MDLYGTPDVWNELNIDSSCSLCSDSLGDTECFTEPQALSPGNTRCTVYDTNSCCRTSTLNFTLSTTGCDFPANAECLELVEALQCASCDPGQLFFYDSTAGTVNVRQPTQPFAHSLISVGSPASRLLMHLPPAVLLKSARTWMATAPTALTLVSISQNFLPISSPILFSQGTLPALYHQSWMSTTRVGTVYSACDLDAANLPGLLHHQSAASYQVIVAAMLTSIHWACLSTWQDANKPICASNTWKR